MIKADNRESTDETRHSGRFAALRVEYMTSCGVGPDSVRFGEQKIKRTGAKKRKCFFMTTYRSRIITSPIL